MKVFVAQRDRRAGARRNRHRRRDAIPRQADAIAEAVGVLEHAVQADRHLAAERLVDVRAEPTVAVHPALQEDLADRLEFRLLHHAIDDATCPAAAEDHRVGPLERLDAIDVVDVAVVLHVVAHPVDEEISGRTVAAHDDLIAVVLSLMGRDAGHVADHVADAHHQLIPDQFLRHDGDRLRHVAQRRGRPGGAADDWHLIAGDWRTDRDRFAQRPEDRIHPLRFAQESAPGAFFINHRSRTAEV